VTWRRSASLIGKHDEWPPQHERWWRERREWSGAVIDPGIRDNAGWWEKCRIAAVIARGSMYRNQHTSRHAVETNLVSVRLRRAQHRLKEPNQNQIPVMLTLSRAEGEASPRSSAASLPHGPLHHSAGVLRSAQRLRRGMLNRRSRRDRADAVHRHADMRPRLSMTGYLEAIIWTDYSADGYLVLPFVLPCFPRRQGCRWWAQQKTPPPDGASGGGVWEWYRNGGRGAARPSKPVRPKKGRWLCCAAGSARPESMLTRIVRREGARRHLGIR